MYKWNNHANQAFLKLKTLFTLAPILKCPDVESLLLKLMHLILVLEQCSVNVSTTIKCVPVLSTQSLSPQPNATMTLEIVSFLAVKMALEECRHWLERASHPFIVLTDHKNLEYLRSAKRLNPRQASWALFFGRFNLSLSYRPGTNKVKPDLLSRILEKEQTIGSDEFFLPDKV